MTKIKDERLAELVDFHKTVPFRSEHDDELVAALSELQSLRAQGGVRVKPLEWAAIDGGNAFRAPALIFGWIRIESYTLHSWQVQWSVPGICNILLPSVFDTVEEAKAAAQADYERRILSSLEASPAPVSEAVTDEMRKRGKEALQVLNRRKMTCAEMANVVLDAALAAKEPHP